MPVPRPGPPSIEDRVLRGQDEATLAAVVRDVSVSGEGMVEGKRGSSRVMGTRRYRMY